MLELKELAQYLTDELNFIGQNELRQEKYSFLIYSELGKSVPDKICGALKTTEPTITPINGIKNIRYNSVVELSVPAPTDNFNLINVEDIIGKMIESLNGREIEFSNGKGLITFTFSRAKDYKMDYAVGEITPITFGVMVNYTENMVTSATKVWQIRPLDVENAPFLTIPYLSESILLEKGGKTSNINDALFQQTLLTSQIKYYRFEIPYETNDTLCSMLQKDILTGDFGKKYELKYYDGVSFTENEPFTSAVSIYRSGDASSRKPDTATFNITFSDVDNGQNTIKYYLALVDNPFDSLSDNTQYFDSQTEQQKYFIGEVVNNAFVPSELLSNGAEFDEIPAPNLNSLYLTNQVYINTRKYDVFDLINKNYAIIKATNGDYTYFFYYRVNSGDIGANGQVNFNMTMDTIQTYLFDPRLTIKGSFIQKAHLDRWVDNGDGTVTFNGRADSKLFEREEIKEVAKRLVARHRLKFDTSNLEMPEVANEENSIFNIEKTPIWVYIFLDGAYSWAGQEIEYSFYKFGQVDGTLTKDFLKRVHSDYIITPTSILAYPLENELKLGEATKLTGSTAYITDITTNNYAFLSFADSNPTLFSHIKAIKLSIKPPLNVNELKYTGELNVQSAYVADFETDGNQNNNGSLLALKPRFVFTTEWGTSSYTTIDNVTHYIQSCLIYLQDDNLTPFDMKLPETNILPQNTFSKTDITGVNGVGVNRNKKFNPKLNNIDYKEATLNLTGFEYKIDLQKLNNRNPKFTYLEPLTCDTTRAIVRYKSESDNEIFNSYFSESYSGLIYSNDLSLPIANGSFENYLANNKNAYLSFQNQQQYALDKLALNSGKNIVSSVLNPVRLIENSSNMLGQSIDIGIQQAYERTQFELTMDNMKSSPLMLSNANGSVLFANAVSKFGVYLELYEGLDTELEMANDIMFRDGYNYNRFGELEDYINIRHNFNYIKAILGNLSGLPISEEARKNFKQRFAQGIRFWKKNNNGQFVIDYTKENYENNLVPTT